MIENPFVDELDEKGRDRFQELIDHKGKMEVGLKSHVELPGLKFCFEGGKEGENVSSGADSFDSLAFSDDEEEQENSNWKDFNGAGIPLDED